ncbi:preprotein translocase subunit SecA [Candidatus Uhrbacteria bacterium CG_4_9_14_0_2_um_filter_41_50]|uniref:Protein translocase subunit SecA n=1 Tax=Candidatus Uhrbacteria bacterium CG_4_9_14_0_2_um_filter_41_50 TaxID=1975031 RepID=A0A2M8EPB6_9BACT|nr:MAG: preprotein translocase subunit SecA [Candidatus Uhrbacteria bacterium CG_4_10_14_3_um_filter_41_21]PIZ54615.1 MAG: preprotein translocase subunit SecA [Candidatus Uhrbacteria bacterium CG_4_10_14_0_2_um_filter_41_21]PJB84256.1 MAG: preprotein translocase subunit SecA [Candidatus Uhrbacteria bacterium CG_4_9_14_0_8_um_filter_41_16]PJC24583.1 MAG: preprotein translocase subunit SecA [Candidatus Uhrbacteria bacterium CG_4_9_14_0_2_um_filter_41_50]PJE74884.1 MAG: preprotein translocase subu
MNNLIKKIFGDDSAKRLKLLQAEVPRVNALESEIKNLTDDQLKAKTGEFQTKVQSGTGLDDIAHEAFAVVREAASRTIKQRHYDVQLIGGLALHQGMIAEMRTGEGKTLTSTLAIYLNALEGKGVHVVTVNDYLAKRDTVWMGQIFHFLGLTIGCIQQEGGYIYDEEFKVTSDQESVDSLDEDRDTTGSFKVQMDFLRPVGRRDAYKADITYGTNNQFGFDYLRDNMATRLEDMVQRDLHYAIIDEVDSILIDEARTPLIISASAEESADLYNRFAGLVIDLKENEDFNLDEKMRVATFTESGLKKMETRLGFDNLYSQGLEQIHHAEQALKAHAIFKKDVDYVVADGEVKIVDEFTGRILEGRRYSEGLHQAIEAKEGVAIKNESRTLATITFQNYFRMYKKLSGMTGTAETEADEFHQIYNLDVAVVPTNMIIAREDRVDQIFKTEKAKFMAVVKKIKELQEKGQPVLIGTASIEKNELIDKLLTQAGIKHEMLNAKNHEREAQIIAQAGRRGSVTVATNMAGRGVDIILGGNPSTKEEQEEVKKLGGLFVVGTERHESRRIDNQLRGRSGRQGDPGVTQFYLSLEDDLMRIFAADRVGKIMDTLRIDENTPIESKMIGNSITKAQERVEGHHFDTRKHVLQYDDVLNRHRTATYGWRYKMLNKEIDPESEIKELVENEIERVVLFHTDNDGVAISNPDELGKKVKTDWDPKEITETLTTILPVESEDEKVIKEIFAVISKDREKLAGQRSSVINLFQERSDQKLKEAKEVLTSEKYDQMLRAILLRANDNAWVRHLDAMTYLRRSIGLRGYGQRDPLIEYKKEAFGLYNDMQEEVQRDVVYNVFKYIAQSIRAQKIVEMAPSILERVGIVFSGAQKTMAKKAAAATLQGAKQETVSGTVAKAGRNEPCPCGSGKKYKKCHGA